ncbi:MAG: TonB-dependent receptor [Acidobacteria bacterium]|nr:TonB-dependent receptor [Acidobacteriota bacterium]MCI0717597.1 TonB-dependent receptor [Acidobacteriota bacterium]
MNRLFELVLKPWVLLLLLGVIGSVPAMAQVETTSRIAGIVTDPSKAVVPGAAVTVRNEKTGAIREASTDPSGYYSVVSLPPGTYTVTVSLSGFKKVEVTGLVLQVASPARVDIALELGSDTQSVTVDAAGEELITTTTSEVSGTISPTLVRDIPLPRQSFIDMLVMTPGVVHPVFKSGLSLGAGDLNYAATGGGGSAGDFTASSVFISGNRDTGTNISIDGSNIQSRPWSNVTLFQSPASVQEVRVQSGNMNAEFGYGVSAVNVITKSGANDYHGTAYEFLRNNRLNAAPFFTNLLGRKLPNYQQNQFGGAIGGPIMKNKLLFFANYEGLRVREAAVSFQQVPAERVFNGDFSGFPTIYNPFSYDPATGLRQPFPGNRIPLGPTSLCAPRPQCADPVTLAFLQKWVQKPNTTVNGIPSLSGNVNTEINSDQYSFRVDFLKSSKATVYGRFSYSEAPQTITGLQPLQGTFNPYGSRNVVVHWTQVIKPTLVNDVMVGYTRPNWAIRRNTAHGNVARDIGLKNTGDLPGAPRFLVPGYNMSVPETYLFSVLESNGQFKNDLSYVRGRHTLKFGIEVSENRMYQDSADNDQGAMWYGNVFSQACPAGDAACQGARAAAGLTAGGDALADFLLGAQTEAIAVITSRYDTHQRYYGAYAQDSWRATSKLTVNFGVRYEYWSPFLVPRNSNAQWDPVNGTLRYALQNPLDFLDPSKCLGKCAPLTPGVPREGYRVSKLDFAPRLGLAYQLTPKTVVRAAAGIYFDGNSDNNAKAANALPPFGTRAHVLNTVDQQLPSVLTSNLFPAPSPSGLPQPNSNPPASFRPQYPYRPNPAVYQWSFSVQRSLNPYWSLELDYLGSHSIHHNQFQDLNSARLPQGEWAGRTLQERRLFPQWGQVGAQLPIGWAKYNAMIASVKNREWHGLTLMANFTWAKGVVTTHVGRSDNGVSSMFAPYILAGESQWVPRNSLQMGYNYTLPFGRGRTYGASAGSVLDKFINGWSVSGITWLSKGSPQPVYASRDLTGVALTRAFPNRICDPSKGPRTRLQWFDTSCFVEAPFGTWPNSPLGAVQFPGVNNWDVSISKSMGIKETHRISFQADMFNAFNHTQWANVNGTLGSSTFGQVLDTRPPRRIQLALRYFF